MIKLFVLLEKSNQTFKKLVLVILFLSILLNLGLAYLFVYHDKIIPFKLDINEQLGLEKKDPVTIALINDIQPDKYEGKQAELNDYVRNFIHDNSVHKEGTDYHTTRAFNTALFIGDIYAYSKGEREDLPHMSCTPAAWAMRSILKAMDKQTRVLLVYNIVDSTLWSHTVMEVYNEDSKVWELHDPDLGVHFKDTTTNERLSFLSLKDRNEANYVPCNGDSCSWDLVWYDWKKKENLAMVRFYYLKEDYKDQVVWIDTRKVNHHLSNYDWKSFFKGEKNIMEF